MPFELGQDNVVYTTNVDVEYWLKNQLPQHLKHGLCDLRELLLDLNDMYKSHIDDPLFKTWSAVKIFDGRQIALVKAVNSYICQQQRGLFDRAWGYAMDHALQIAQDRLQQVFPDRDTDKDVDAVYNQHRRELLEKAHKFITPQFVNQIFTKWNVLDVKLDKITDRWCFVLTSAYKHIGNVLDHFTECRPQDLDRCLEHGFRTLLGERKSPLLDCERFSRNSDWYIRDPRATQIRYINQREINMHFISFRDT